MMSQRTMIIPIEMRGTYDKHGNLIKSSRVDVEVEVSKVTEYICNYFGLRKREEVTKDEAG